MKRTLITLAVAASLAGCGGGAGSSTTPLSNGGSGTSNQSYNEQSVGTANSAGAAVKNLASFEKGVSPLSSALRIASASGTCNNGFEFFAPDVKGDANSTEAKYFYDSACTQPARDVVRVFVPATQGASSATETIQINESQYAMNNATAIASRTENVTLTAPSASDFDKNGFASLAAGFERTSSDSLSFNGGANVIVSDAELVMSPASAAGQNGYCSDAAGFNQTGIASLSETFGWNGGVNGGSRAVNSDGSVTWTSTHAGTSYKAAIGGLSISTGTPNGTCPIASPLYTLSGGTQVGAYNIPMTVTMMHGMLQSVSVSGAQLANGNTLNMSSSGSPTSPNFVSGTISNGSTQIATFSTDAFGDGTLTVAKTGAQYVIQDWHVVH